MMMLLHALEDYLYLSVPSRVDRIGLHVYIALLEPLLGFMVSVSSRVALTWNTRTVVLDEQFVVEIKNQKYVKIQGSHPTWLKLLQGHSRGTLSGSDGMQELKKKRDLEVLRQVTKKDADKDLFSDDEDKEKEALKGIVDFEPGFVVLDTGLQLGVYSRHKSTHDLLVLLDEKHLEQAFEILTTDAPPAKRPYKKKKTGDLSDLPAIPDEVPEQQQQQQQQQQTSHQEPEQPDEPNVAEEPAAAGTIPGDPAGFVEQVHMAATGFPNPSTGQAVPAGFPPAPRVVPPTEVPASWMAAGAGYMQNAEYHGGGCCHVHGVHRRAALELELRFLELVPRAALELHLLWFLDLVFRTALELHLRFLQLVLQAALELQPRFLELVLQAALELHQRLMELVLQAALQLHQRLMDLVNGSHRLAAGAKDLLPRAAGNLVVGRCIRQLAAAILLVAKASGMHPPEWGGHGAHAEMMPPEWGGPGAPAETNAAGCAEDQMTAPGVSGEVFQLGDRDMEHCLVSSVVRLGSGGSCSKGDVVLVKPAASGRPWDAGQVWLHVEVHGVCWTLVSMWQFLSLDPGTDSACWVEQASIEETEKRLESRITSASSDHGMNLGLLDMSIGAKSNRSVQRGIQG
ncbi:hypothetical protein AK812_SmicGene41256, partial [Symbiodinium microadriaticum]